jgi:phospholipase C
MNWSPRNNSDQSSRITQSHAVPLGVVHVTRVALAARFWFSLCVILLANLLLSSCGGGGGSTGGGRSSGDTTPTVTLNSDKNNVDPGTLVTLSWTVTNATNLVVSPSVSEDPLTLPTGSAQVAPTVTTTYIFTASGSSGTSQSSITVNVKTVAPTITFTAAPASILSGQSSTLSWNTENATAVTIDNGVGSVAPTGTKSVTPTATTTYTATATGPGGSTTATATVTVGSGSNVQVSISANPQTITAGQLSTLTWTTQNAISATLNGQAVATSGTQNISPAGTTVYTLVGTDAGGNTDTKQVTVTVLPANSGLQNLKHIIFYMNENRSFDDIFGMLGQYRQSKGLPADIDGLDVNQIFTDYYGDQVKPFHMPTTCMEVTSPGWNESHFFAHRNSTTGVFGMDFWMRQQTDSQGSTIDPHYTRSMGYMDQTDLPYYYELATQFATSDRWFSDLMGPTVPNRMYLYTGTSFGWIRPNPDPNHPPYTQKTIFQLLNEHGISWKYYYTSGDVFLAQFDLWADTASQGRVRNISEYYTLMADPNADKLLPQVIFIEQVAGWQMNEHPDNKWGLQPGAANTKKLIDALIASKAWATSAFIYTYDEAGGIHDHVPPIAVPAPDNTPPNFKSTDGGTWDAFTYSGFRTPVIVVSPWVKKNFVSHTPRTTSSILKLIETRYSLPALTNRDANADDMAEFFDFSSPSWMTPPPMPEQPWFCDPNDPSEAKNPTCQTIINWLGPPTGQKTCDLSHKLEVAPGHPVGQ